MGVGDGGELKMGLEVAGRVGKGDWPAAVGGDTTWGGEKVGGVLEGVEAETGAAVCVLLGLP